MRQGFYGNHPQGTVRKSGIARRKRASAGQWRTSDGVAYPVTVRKVGA